MKITKAKIISLLCLAVAMVSCGTTSNTQNANAETIYNKWEINQLDGKTVASESPVFIELTSDNKVSGSVGCNRVTGSFIVENESQISFSQLATTRMMCAPQQMEIERQLLEMLNTADNFTLNEGILSLNVGRRAPLATFVVMSDLAIVNKYWKLIELDSKPVVMVENQEREQYFLLRSNGSVSGFAGCNRFNGHYELTDANTIKFNPNMAMTMMACPDVAINESEFMQVFQLTDNYSIENDTLKLKIGKNRTKAVFAAIYM